MNHIILTLNCKLLYGTEKGGYCNTYISYYYPLPASPLESIVGFTPGTISRTNRPPPPRSCKAQWGWGWGAASTQTKFVLGHGPILHWPGWLAGLCVHNILSIKILPPQKVDDIAFLVVSVYSDFSTFGVGSEAIQSPVASPTNTGNLIQLP